MKRREFSAGKESRDADCPGDMYVPFGIGAKRRYRRPYSQAIGLQAWIEEISECRCSVPGTRFRLEPVYVTISPYAFRPQSFLP
jgi:hypothetical protein